MGLTDAAPTLIALATVLLPACGPTRTTPPPLAAVRDSAAIVATAIATYRAEFPSETADATVRVLAYEPTDHGVLVRLGPYYHESQHSCQDCGADYCVADDGTVGLAARGYGVMASYPRACRDGKDQRGAP